MYELCDLERIKSRLVKPRQAEAHQPSLLGINLPFTGRRFLLKIGINLIGRATHNDIVLNDPGVSAIHAKIVYEGDSWRVMNLLSTNGTFVNNEKQTTTSLKPGDRVRFGRAEFLFDYDDRSSPSTEVIHRILSLPWLRWILAGVVLLAMVAMVFVLSGY
jgi:pSer/pThr/pTyr-binding forkhead associated (FHA) protein